MYILRYSKSIPQSISVQAWPRLGKYATKREKYKPSFTIGSVKGNRTIMLWHYVEELQKKYKKVDTRSYRKMLYPPEDPQAINDAYRLGLAAAVISAAEDTLCATTALSYVLTATKEEIWFWTSKLLGVIGSRRDRPRVLNSLYVLSGATKLKYS